MVSSKKLVGKAGLAISVMERRSTVIPWLFLYHVLLNDCFQGRCCDTCLGAWFFACKCPALVVLV